MRAAGVALVIAAALVTAARAEAGPDHVRVELRADQTAIVGGRPFIVGVHLQIDPGWHVYWTNPGDSGLPTRVKLHLPPGFTAGPVSYPVPSVLKLPGGITNYGYERDAVLMVDVRPPAELSAGQSVPVTADVDYLVCSDVCLPGKATPALNLHVAGPDESVAADPTGDFGRWERRLPRHGTVADVAGLSLSPGPAPAGETVAVDWVTPPHQVSWVPDLPDGWSADGVTVVTDRSRTTVSYTLNRNGSTTPLTPRRGLLVFTPAEGRPVGLYIPPEPLTVLTAAAPATRPRPERTNP